MRPRVRIAHATAVALVVAAVALPATASAGGKAAFPGLHKRLIGQSKLLASSLDQLQSVLRQAMLGVEETAVVRALIVTMEKRLQAMETEQRRLARTLAAPPTTESETNAPATPVNEK